MVTVFERRPGGAYRRGAPRWLAGGLAALMLLAVGVALGRSTAAPAAAPPAERAGGEAAAPEPGATPAETSAFVPSLPGLGPRRVEAGVPVGYAHSEAGAVAAAAHYAEALGGPLVLVDEARRAALAAIAAPGAVERLEAQYQPGAEVTRDRLGLDAETMADPGFVLRSLPAGYRVASYDETAADVEIWGTGVLVVPGVGQPVPPRWNTTTVSLVWHDGDWRLQGTDTRDGPTPPPVGDPGGALAAADINDFRPFRYAPPSG